AHRRWTLSATGPSSWRSRNGERYEYRCSIEDAIQGQRSAAFRHHHGRRRVLAVCPDDAQYRARHGPRPWRECKHDERRGGHYLAVLGHLHRGDGRVGRSRWPGEGYSHWLLLEHRRLTAGGHHAAGSVGNTS